MLKLKKNRVYIVIIVLIIVFAIKKRYVVIKHGINDKGSCELLLDKWRTGCIFCNQNDFRCYYVVRFKKKKILRFYRENFQDDIRSYFSTHGALTINNDTLDLCLKGVPYFIIRVPLNGKVYKIKDIDIQEYVKDPYSKYTDKELSKAIKETFFDY